MLLKKIIGQSDFVKSKEIVNYDFIKFTFHLQIENIMGCEPSNAKEQNSINQLHRRDFKNNVGKFNQFYDSKYFENVTLNNMKPDQDDQLMLEKAFSDHFFFYKLRKNQRAHLIQNLDGYETAQNQIVFNKGDPANLFFYIKSGSVLVDIGDGSPVKTLKAGEYFGQLALLYKAPRSATIKTQQKCIFFCLCHKSFRKIMQQLTIHNFSNVKSHIEKAPIFKYLTNRQKVSITYNTHTLKYQDNDIIFKEGDDANSFFIITKGKVKIEIKGKKQIIMEEDQSFGENSFQVGSIRSGTAIAINEVSVLSIGRESLKKCIGGFLEEMSLINIMKWSIARHQVLERLNDLQREKLISIAQIKEFKNGQVIQALGNVPSKFYICLEQSINGKGIGSIHLFESIFDSENQRVLSEIKKEKDGKVAVFEFSKIKKVLDKNLNRLFQEPLFIPNTSDEKKIYYDNLTLDKLTIKHELGEGLFGKVYCVEDTLKFQYALKCIQKRKTIENQMEKFIILEKKILQEVSSPFIVKLYKTMNNSDYVFFLMKYIDGGDFFKILRNIGICNKHKSQFYLGCLLLAIQHLHKKNIIYRDVKPENTVADKQGFLYLVDLGTAKNLEESTGYKTFTIVGTPHYMAPQIIHGEGYSFGADLWSIGVFFYEMVCGELPFGNDFDDPYEIFKKIQQSTELKIPTSYTDPSGIMLMEKLMARDERERMIEDFSKIKNMAYFQDFNWENLEKKKMNSPLRINRQKLNTKIDRNLLTFLLQRRQQKDAEDNADEDKQEVISTNFQWNKQFCT